MNTQTKMRRAGFSLTALLVLSLLVESAFGQGLTSVSGVVTDETNAVLKGVAVRLRNDSTGREWNEITNENGWYSVAQLLPENYTLRLTLQGFKTQVVRVALHANDPASVDIRLDVGDTATVVEVTAPPPRGTPFDQPLISELPLQTLNVVGLLPLYAGVTLPEKLGEFARDDGGQVNGARNDQQNIQLDGANINQQELGGALEGVLPITVDSVQNFVVQTSGFGGSAGRGSGAQVQITTKSGTDAWHGVLSEYYRTTGTSARNYFAPEATPLIRHLPGAAAGGPLVKGTLFFFGDFEHQSDRSATLQNRSVPTPEFLNGIVRYRRTDGSFGVLTDGTGSNLEQLTLNPGDRWNAALIGPSGIFQQYKPFSSDAARTSPSATDGGANILTYRFNAPFIRDRNIYISRIDYNLGKKNSVFFRGTLNDDVRTLAPDTFPGFKNASERIDNSKGFITNWNSAISPGVNSSFSFGLTRESFEDTGNQVSAYLPGIFTSLQQTAGAQRQAINTWPISETLSWQMGRHTLQAGVEHRYIDNKLQSFNVVILPTYSGQANITGGGFGSTSSPALRRALGDAEFARLSSPTSVADAVMVGTGSIARLTESAQFDLSGKQLPGGSPFTRNFILKEWDLFLEDTFRFSQTNLTLTYGLHYSLQTPPYERNGVQMNWTEDLGQRWREMGNTTKTITAFPLLTTTLSGRANGLADYYKTDTNNLAPRVGIAWAVGSGSGLWRELANKGGPMTVRASYAMTYDRIGGRFGRDAATMGSIGLLTTYTSPSNLFSIDGLNGTSRAPRIAQGSTLPRAQFPVINQPSFTLPPVTAGPGGTTTVGIDPNLHSPTSHLLNLTISKQLPGGWTVESSYVGRFARDLLGQVDIASPPNVRDAASGMTWYQATNELFTRYLEKGAAVSDVQPIAWYENVYPEIKGFVEGRLNRSFTSVTQAFYAYLLQQNAATTPTTPGLTAPVSQIDRFVEIELGLGRNKLLNPQVQFLGLFGNFSRSNYHSGQFTARKRFGHGLSATLNYTLSKSMDITSAAEARGNRANGQTGEGLATDPFDPGRAYALSDFDRRHQFSSYFLADLPFGRNRWLGGNSGSTLNQIIGGWQVSGIVVGASGRPWNFTDSRFNFHFAGRDQPQVIAPIPFELTKLPNKQVFMIPGTTADRTRIARENFKNSYPGGAVARNQGRGPGYWNMDFAMTKNFDLSSIRESMKLRFRWEAFNLFNHPNFDIPSSALSGGGTNIDRAGTQSQIETTLGTERVMQFGVRLEF